MLTKTPTNPTTPKTQQNRMTIDSIEKALLGAGIAEAKTEAYILAEHFLSIPRSRLVLMRLEKLDSPELERAVERRISREPLAYITGAAYFMDEVYRVTPDCLIPRPETELLVLEAEAAVKDFAKRSPAEAIRVLDLCTGSGCVAISLLRRCNAIADALDISAPAVRIAEENAVSNGVSDRINVICADMFHWEPTERYAVITANPPYVTVEEMDHLDPELYFEPSNALTDGGDGLSFIRELCTRYTNYLFPGGVLLCEIGSGEGADSLKIARESGFDGEILRDLSGRDRILKIKL